MTVNPVAVCRTARPRGSGAPGIRLSRSSLLSSHSCSSPSLFPPNTIRPRLTEPILPVRDTGTQAEIRRAVREFAAAEILPHASRWDEEEVFPRETIRALGALGFLGPIFPEEYGGAGFGYTEYAVLIEELARADASVAITVAAHVSLAANHLYEIGTEEQKAKFLAPLASGKALGAWGLTEPEAGSDAGGTRTTAVRDGGHWVLNGSKTFTTNGAEAEIAICMASTRPGFRTRGISAFIVERGTPGFRSGRKEKKLGHRASDTSEMVFEDCRVPTGNLLGTPGSGFPDAMRVLDGGRISIAALSLGIARAAFECAADYARERQQFERPIGDFQGVRFPLADSRVEIEASHLLIQSAAALKDSGARTTTESAMAKLHASETAVRVTNRAVQILGGYGYIRSYPVERYLRDAKLMTIGEGTSEIQRLLIARPILGRADD